MNVIQFARLTEFSTNDKKVEYVRPGERSQNWSHRTAWLHIESLRSPRITMGPGALVATKR